DSVGDNIRAIRQGRESALQTDVPTEIKPLVSEFNQLLSTWRGHLQRSRNATGNLAHALKSPLHLIYQSGIENDQPVVQEQAERMQQIIERELNRARIAGSASAGRRFQPYQDSQDLINTINILFQEKGLDIRTEVDTPDQLPFEQDDMQELLGNLLDNAAKWAKQRILLSLKFDNGLLITLHDDGPGIEQSATEALLTRGRRLDEQTPGHGLGLSIVQDIVEQYQGTIAIGRSEPLGGACLSVTLPISID
ncbi:MAG: ATP-binding protein, partial [Chromatiales bacterium]|nr:ATP-binding protein [Chromatiales bacterium]